jgi:uncharacterized protein
MNKDVFNRRQFLAVTGSTVAGAAFIGLATTPSWARSVQTAASLPEVGVSVSAFPLTQVSLLAGPFQNNMNRTLAYLSFVNADRLLYTFRANVGVSTLGAAACGGWEAPAKELRGHSTGHLMSALAQAYANTGTAAYKTKGDYLVAELAKCQAASPKAGFHTGYLSAFPESFFDLLEANKYVWSPYYTIHKILAGLLDLYNLTGNAQALTVATGIGDWVNWRTGRSQFQQVAGQIGQEWGSLSESMVNLAVYTGKSLYLTAAQRFDQSALLDPLVQNKDQLKGLHGNTQIAKTVAYIREYEYTGTQQYADAVTNFWDIVVNHHSYAIGGNTNHEFFDQANQIAGQLSIKTCECCNTYNMLKIARQLFFHNPNRADYMDWYEKALWNQTLGQQDPNSAHGFVAYSIPLVGIRVYSNDYNDFTCDHGTGMESNTKYMDSIYFVSNDGTTLYVNLFIASQLNWTQKNMTITQNTTFPETNTSRITITGSGNVTIKIRVPSWTNGQMQIRVNGTLQSVAVTPNTYVALSRSWKSGDVIDLTMPMSLHLEPTPDSPTTQAVKYGPIVLSGAYGSTAVSVPPNLTTSSIKPVAGTPLQYQATANNTSVTLIPFYKNHQNYAVYWNTH